MLSLRELALKSFKLKQHRMQNKDFLWVIPILLTSLFNEDSSSKRLDLKFPLGIRAAINS